MRINIHFLLNILWYVLSSARFSSLESFCQLIWNWSSVKLFQGHLKKRQPSVWWIFVLNTIEVSLQSDESLFSTLLKLAFSLMNLCSQHYWSQPSVWWIFVLNTIEVSPQSDKSLFSTLLKSALSLIDLCSQHYWSQPSVW